MVTSSAWRSVDVQGIIQTTGSSPCPLEPPALVCDQNCQTSLSFSNNKGVSSATTCLGQAPAERSSRNCDNQVLGLLGGKKNKYLLQMNELDQTLNGEEMLRDPLLMSLVPLRHNLVFLEHQVQEHLDKARCQVLLPAEIFTYFHFSGAQCIVPFHHSTANCPKHVV